MSLLVCGTIAFDDITTPMGRAARILGGSATYCALAASFFTAVRIAGVVGEDFTPDDEALLRERNIDTAGIERAPGKCFFWRGEYEADPNRRHTLLTELNVLDGYRPRLPAACLDSEYLFLGNMDPESQCAVRDQLGPVCRFAGGDTMNYWIAGQPQAVRRFLSRLHLLVINDSEAQQLAGDHNLHRAARSILNLGPQAVVIKRGEHGATLYTGRGYFGIPGYPLEDVCDPTGAGDSFAGGMLGYIASQGGWGSSHDPYDGVARRAVVYGSVMGSFACERFGVTRLTEITKADVEARYNEFIALTRFHA